MTKSPGHMAAARSLLVVPSSLPWHAEAEAEQTVAVGKKNRKSTFATIEQWRAHAEKLMATQTTLFESTVGTGSKSEHEWIKTVSQQGTVSDKIAALTLLFQEGPMYRLSALQQLLEMAQKSNKREVTQAADAIKSIMLADVLPDRKLKYLRDHEDWIEQPVSDRVALLRFFEDGLKKFYLSFVKVLEMMTHDTVPQTRRVALVHVYDLLAAKPEQEKNLLTLLVDKLGDLDRSIAAKAGYLLQQLLVQHPNMKGVVVGDTEALIFRPNVSMRARYYALIMLNQIILTKDDKATANHLIDVYFALYGQLVNKDDFDTKMLSALLTGVNRAFPFSEIADETFEKHLDTLFRIVHVSSFNTGVQALLLLFHIVSKRQTSSDRFYRVLYEMLLDRRLFGSSKQPLFLNLLYKAIKADSLLTRVKAFLKRIVQIALYQQPTFICASLILMSEVLKLKPTLWSAIKQPEKNRNVGDDVEHFVDKDENDEIVPSRDNDKGHSVSAPRSDMQHLYDPRKRDPKFSNADVSCFWELNELAIHYHPSAAKFAQTLLQGDVLSYNGDPLGDFTLANFLERFVYKNPKKDAGIPTRGSSIMQPHRHVRPHADIEPVFNESFVAKSPDNIPPDQVFYYNYFKEHRKQMDAAAKKQAKRRGHGDQDDDALVNLSEEQIDEALGLTSELLEGSEDEDDTTASVGDEDDDSDQDGNNAVGIVANKPANKGPAGLPINKPLGDIDLDDDDAGYEGLEDALEAADAEDRAMAASSRADLFAGEDNDESGDDEDADVNDSVEAGNASDDDADVDADMEVDDNEEETEEDMDDEDAFAQALLDDEDEDDDDGDEDGNDEDDEGENEEDDEDEVDEEDDEDDEDDAPAKPLSRRAQKILANKQEHALKGIKLDGSMFASAEDFSHLLDETVTSSKGSDKQARWEDRGRYSRKRQHSQPGKKHGGSHGKRPRR